MKHWDLTPKQTVTLIREDGKRIDEAQFLFRDTVRAYFELPPNGRYKQFALMDDGTLKDSPTREQLLDATCHVRGEYGSPRSFERALERCKRWSMEPVTETILSS